MKKILVALILCASFSSANAAIVTWTLQGVTFNDGGTAFGSFDFDSETDRGYSNINITTTSGSAFGGGQYINPINRDVAGFDVTDTSVIDPTTGLAITEAGDLRLELRFGSTLLGGLTSGTISLGTRREAVCAVDGCLSIFIERTITAGSISATTVVPLPASFMLFGSCLALLGLLRRKIT